MATSRTGAARYRSHAVALGVCSLLAVASTWPLATRLGQLVPLGPEPSPVAPYRATWALWWISDRLAAGLQGFWDAPIFHPARLTLALDEPNALLGFVAAPLWWLNASPSAIYGLVVLGVLTLNGWLACSLLLRLRLAPLAAVAGGAMMVMLPYVHQQLGALHLIPLAGVLWLLRSLLDFAAEPSPRRGVVLGLSFGATYLLAGQHAYLFTMAVVPAAPWLLERGNVRPSSLAWLLLAALVAAACIAPVAAMQLKAASLYGMELPPERALSRGADWASWIRTPWPQLVAWPGLPVAKPVNSPAFFPGVLKVALAAVGLVWAIRQRYLWRVTAFLATFGLSAGLLAMLPGLEVAGTSPFLVLRELLPGLAKLRVIWRAGVFAQIVLVLLASFGIAALADALRRASRFVPARLRERGGRQLVVVALVAIACVELWPRGQRFVALPSLAAWQPFLQWVREETDPGDAMLYLPRSVGRSGTQYVSDTRWMVLQTAHGRPMVNGFASYVPRRSPERRELMEGLAEFPTEKSRRAFEKHGVRYVVIRRSWAHRTRRSELPASAWRPVFTNRLLDIVVYELVPSMATDGATEDVPSAPTR